MTTARNLIAGSLRLLGAIQAGETPSNDDMQIALEAFNQLLDSWSNNNQVIYKNQPNYFSVTGSKASYTLGPGGDWNTPRPIRIDEAYVSSTPMVNGVYTRTSSTIEWPLQVANEKQYADVPMKGIRSTIPVTLYDDGDAPLRKISFFPVPTQAMTVILWLTQPLTTITSLDDELEMPAGYERALRFNLAIELSAEFGKTLDPQIVQIANEALDLIARTNTQDQIMSLDNAVVNKPRYSWVFGDTVRR